MSEPAEASPSPPGDVSQALHRLRALGGRITASRREMVELFFSRDRGFTATDIANRLPELDPATVYRALNQLEQAGIVEHAHLGHGPATYRRTGSRTVLAVCEACGAVADVPVAELDAVRDRLRNAYGFVVDVRHFALTGRCAACAEARPGGGTRTADRLGGGPHGIEGAATGPAPVDPH
jgi:Fur family ferric uptake transcriptional regulator